jgi:phosphate transport system protein
VGRCSTDDHLPLTFARQHGPDWLAFAGRDLPIREGRRMREVFQQELREVQERLVEISGLVAVSIENATRAFNESNVSLAETVIADDDKIDELTVSLDELAIDILARQQPVARDLRIVVSALRISASLERMGDMAEHIAQLARYRFPEKVVPKGLRGTFKDLGALDVEIAKKLTELLQTEDVRLAEEIRNDDDKIDALHLSVFDKVLGETWKGAAVDTVDATLASRYHERFADHAVSIAKKVQYLATGDWIPTDD